MSNESDQGKIWIRHKYNLLMLVVVAFFCIVVYHSLPIDLSTNLISESVFFAITILVLNKILERQKLQKSRRSIEYARNKILRICGDLIWGLSPSLDWETTLLKTSDYVDFFKETIHSKEEGRKRLEDTIDKYHYLIDSELRNDIFDLKVFLEMSSYLEIVVDRTDISDRDKLSLLRDFSSQNPVLIGQAIKVIKKHNLIAGEVRSVEYSPGELPKVEVKRIYDVEKHKELSYQGYERLLQESIKIRDKIDILYLKSTRDK